ncbi:MAG: hypothetical protein U0R50_09240 [Gaiellales bacterium]
MTRAILLTADEAELILAELEPVEAAVTDPGRSAAFAALRAAVELGDLDGAAIETLDPLLELALQTGRVRAIHGPGGEQTALQLYRRLPSGVSLRQTAAEVTEALGVLEGRELERISLSAHGPAAFSLSLNAGGVELTLRLDRQGARVASVVA